MPSPSRQRSRTLGFTRLLPVLLLLALLLFSGVSAEAAKKKKPSKSPKPPKPPKTTPQAATIPASKPKTPTTGSVVMGEPEVLQSIHAEPIQPPVSPDAYNPDSPAEDDS